MRDICEEFGRGETLRGSSAKGEVSVKATDQPLMS